MASKTVAWVESVGAYVVMPSSYDAGRVTADDVAHDSSLRTLTRGEAETYEALSPEQRAVVAAEGYATIVEYGDARMVVTTDATGTNVMVDGESTPRTCRAGKVEEAVRAACEHAFPEAGRASWAEGGEAWDAMSYSRISL